MMITAIAATGFAPLASNRPPLVRHTPTSVRTHSPQLLLPELPLTLLAATDIDAYASSAEQLRDGLAAGDAIWVFVLLGLTGVIAIIGMDDDTISLSGDPMSTKASDDQRTATPGWLTCDMRVPLPEYADLLNACHLLNTLDECAFAPPAHPSPDFSTLPSHCRPAWPRAHAGSAGGSARRRMTTRAASPARTSRTTTSSLSTYARRAEESILMGLRG